MSRGATLLLPACEEKRPDEPGLREMRQARCPKQRPRVLVGGRPREGSGMTGASLLINGFGVLFVILNSFGLGLRLPVGRLLAQVAAHRKIALWALVINFVIIPLLFVAPLFPY